MYITPIGAQRPNYRANILQKRSNISYSKKINEGDTVSFSGAKIVDPKILKNKFLILMTQDKWGEKLDIKMPESEIEKEALLEFLENRKALDGCVRLMNERGRILMHKNWLSHVKVKDPSNPFIKDSEQELAKRGNIETVLKTLDKKIALAKAKNKQAADFFENLDKIEEEYISTKQVKNNELEKYWAQIRKNNINKEHKYTTQELIDIIKGEKSAEQNTSVEKSKPVVKKITRKDILTEVEANYEKFLRENLSIYLQNFGDANVEGQRIIKEYLPYENKFPGIKKQLIRTIEDKIRKYNFKIASLGQARYYQLDERHIELVAGIKLIKNKSTELAALKKVAKKNKDDKKAQTAVTKAEKSIEKYKRAWIKALKEGVEAEAHNREIFSKTGKGDAYEYLMGENKNVRNYKKLYAIIKENKGKLPDEVWADLLV